MKIKQILMPPQPAAIHGVANPVIGLNTSDGGIWKFLFESPENVPLPDAINQDFDFSVLPDNEWKNVFVPGELSMQGFAIHANTEYYYQRKVYIPADYAGCRIIARFDGVYSYARVWANGRYARTHKGGFTSWDCDITDYAKAGETLTLTVGVADIRGIEKGNWNPEGKQMDDASGAAFYACHNIGGITRDVTLLALPADYIADIYINTVFENNYTEADLTISAQLMMVSSAAALKIELFDRNGSAVSETCIDFENPEGGSALSDERKAKVRVKSPLTWDAEHPNLYTLKAVLTADGIEKETTLKKIGLREITFGGAKGTDRNKVYINGKEVKLRGVCRHDVSYKSGRSTSKEEDYAEILDYKKCNINFIRTSHYPVSRHLLDACEELGIYVEEENAACWGPVSCPPEEYLNGFKEMFIRDRNRACILIWSLANESTWAEPFEMEYNYIRKEDPTRLVIFSYAHTSSAKFDICSVHYDTWDSKILGDSREYYKMWKLENLYDYAVPVLHDEYCPPAVHHYYEMQKDLGARNFWGESVYRFWDNVFEADGALGGAIWAAGDEIFFIPDGVTKFTGPQGHSDGPTAGCGNWGVVHDVYKRLKPEAHHTKKGYSPVFLSEKDFKISGDTLEIPVKNRFDHTDFSELKILYSADGEPAKEIASPSIAPHKPGYIYISGLREDMRRVNLKFFTSFNGEEMMVDEFNVSLKEETYKFAPASLKAPALAETADIITISGEDFAVIFDKETAQIKTAAFKGYTLITGGPHFYIADADRGRWAGTVAATIADNMAVATLAGEYADGQGVIFTVKISGDGIIVTDYTLTTEPAKTDNLKEAGISYDIPPEIESVSWIRSAFHSVYPENHTGRAEGVALKVRKNADSIPDKYGVKPSWSWKDDMSDFSLYHNNDPNDGIVTNDFKTMREHIWNYTVRFAGTDSGIGVESENARIAARVDVKADWELIDDGNPRIKYTGNWTKRENHICESKNAYTDNYSYGKTESLSNTAGDMCELTFEGTGICFISAKDCNLGIVKVYIDGEFKEEINTYAGWGESKRRAIYCVNGLPYGEHVIKLETVRAAIAVDAFGVLKKNPANQVSRLIINDQWYYPNLSWGSYSGIPGKLKNSSAGSATIRLTDRK